MSQAIQERPWSFAAFGICTSVGVYFGLLFMYCFYITSFDNVLKFSSVYPEIPVGCD